MNNFFKENIHNYSTEYPFLWDELIVLIRTGSDYKKAREVSANVLNNVFGEYAANNQVQRKGLSNKYKVEAAQIEPIVTLRFDKSWITFTLRHIIDYKKEEKQKT